MSRCRWAVGAVLLGVALAAGADAQAPNKGAAPAGPAAGAKAASDIELVERVLAARRDYQVALEALRAHYVSVNDGERARWAEDELRQYHRIPKQAYRLDLDVPAATLKAELNIPEANELYRRAMAYKDRGWGTDYLDNQRRAELLFQQILTSYPQSDKIDDAAYQLGDIYESKAYKQYKRAAAYYERCVQWNPNTQFDARLRAARLYDKALMDRTKARELYQDVINHETDPRWLDEAKKRMTELSSGR
jgi:TolA-binding protein